MISAIVGLLQTTLTMKKIIALIFLAGFVSACSQYTCPTYAKKDAPKKEAAEQKL